jgi:uncharacterized protein (DUF2141 family)
MSKKILFFLILLLPKFNFAQQTTLNITIDNVQNEKGVVRIAVYNEQNHLKKKYVWSGVLPANATKLNTNIPIASGNYSVAVSQDLNKNDKLDTNIMGVPQEPYGFSNNARPKFRAPTFGEAKIEVGATQKNIYIRLEKW